MECGLTESTISVNQNILHHGAWPACGVFCPTAMRGIGAMAAAGRGSAAHRPMSAPLQRADPAAVAPSFVCRPL